MPTVTRVSRGYPRVALTGLDWIIVAVAALFALSGFHRGFIVGALSVVGFVGGAVLGTRIAQALLTSGSASPYKPVFGLFGAVLAGGILATGFEGLGLRVRGALRLPGIGALDGILGAALSACVALGIMWVLGAVALQAPGTGNLRRDIQRSLILQRLNELLPPSGVILDALARIDPLPAFGGPAPPVAPPSPAIARAPAVRASFGSVVRVLGSACGLGIEGSGWVAGPDEIVTNAHVVAGETDTVVQVRGAPPDLPARAILLDSHNDIAVLRVPGLGLPALRLASAAVSGESAAILGYPQNGPFAVRAARIGTTEHVVSQDAYGRGPVTRQVTPLRGVVRPGNSGGPLVDDGGRVVATVFASTTGGGPHGGFGVANAVVAADLARAGPGPVSTGPCAG